MPCSRAEALAALAAALIAGARLELCLTPKPGLVDRADNGSHDDLFFALMQRSIDLLAIYFAELSASLVAGEAFACQQEIARAAERRMLAALGTNTHKGFIFLGGMLLIARWQAGEEQTRPRSAEEAALRRALSVLSSEFFAQGATVATNGESARRTFATGGIVREAIAAYPAVFEQALPAFRRAVAAGESFENASFAMLARLMQCVDDTTTLHRGGAAALARVKADGAHLERVLAARGDAIAWLAELNRSYVAARLTIGGIADMLGVAYALLIVSGEVGANGAIACRKQMLTI